jgi:hypothetical protein
VGTSGAYGGTPGWQGVSDQTQQWIDDRPSDSQSTDDKPSDRPGETGGALPQGDPNDPKQPAPTRPSPRLTPLLSGLGRRLAADVGSGGSGARPRRGGGVGRGSRSSSRTARAGARAAAGVYGLRGGVATALAELGLTLADLEGLSRSEQARRIVDAAMGPAGGIAENEMRRANSSLVLWALSQEIEPTPAELVQHWVIEYVWEVWVTEAGARVGELAANGQDRIRIEQEVRAALEALVTARSLPADRALTTQDFQTAIQETLASLGRITEGAA